MRWQWIFILIFLLSTDLTFGKVSSTIPVQDEVYDDLDWLIARGHIEPYLKGHLPLNRMQIADLISSLVQEFENSKLKNSNVSELFWQKLNRLKKRFSSELVRLNVLPNPKNNFEIHLLETATLDTTWVTSNPRDYFLQRQIDGTYSPLLNYQEGRSQNPGLQHLIETEHRFRLKDIMVGYFRPRFELQFENSLRSADANLHVQELYAGFYFWNTDVYVGQKNLQLGQSRYGGFALTNNAKPFPMIQVANRKPYSFFKEKFKIKYNFSLGVLNHESGRRDPLFSSLKISFQLFKNLEIGMTRALIFGGPDAPNASFFDYFQEYFLFRPNDGALVNLGNSFNGGEIRFRIPKWRGLELYTEVFYEDEPFPIFQQLDEETAIKLGIYAPSLGDSGSWNARVEARRMVNLIYHHAPYQAGWTHSAEILGEPIGPDSQSLQITIGKIFNDDLSVKYQFDFESIDSDVYSANAERGRFIVTDGLREKRFRNQLTFKKRIRSRFLTQVRLAHEHINDFDFVDGQNQNHFLLSFAVRIDLDDHFGLKF